MAREGVPINRAKLLKAIDECEGRQALICKKMKMASSTLYTYIHSDPEVAMAIDNARHKRHEEEDDEDEENLRIARKNAAKFLKDITLKVENACLSMTQSYKRRQWQRRDREQEFAPWQNGPKRLKLDITGLDADADE